MTTPPCPLCQTARFLTIQRRLPYDTSPADSPPLTEKPAHPLVRCNNCSLEAPLPAWTKLSDLINSVPNRHPCF